MSAALLFLLERAFGKTAEVVIPRLIDLIDTSPRLAMLGFLALFVSPGVAVALLHRMTSRKLDRFELQQGRAVATTIDSMSLAVAAMFFGMERSARRT